jgi:hypothetical protein
MAITNLTTNAKDKGTYAVTVTFKDENGNLVVPTEAKWTLKNKKGVTVNLRTQVAITPLASSVVITLSGDDLKASDGRSRILTVEGKYNSTLGMGLPIKDSCVFQVEDLYGV